MLSNVRLTVVHSPPPEDHAPVLSPTSTPAPLTKANLRQLERMTKSGSKSGKSDHSSKTGKTSTTTTTPSGGAKSLSTTDHQFETLFRANGGVSVVKSSQYPPSNKQEIKEYIRQARGSESPTSSQHNRFLNSLESAGNERDIENLMQGRVFKDTNKTDKLQDIDYRANVDKQWVAYPKNVGFNNGLSAPKPDLVEGYAQRAFPPSIRQLGGSATLVHDSPAFVGLPHFAAEFKDYGKSMREAEVQTGYDGAHMVYSRNKALEHIGDKDPPRRASPLTVASDGHSWSVYSHYAHPDEDTNKDKYYQVRQFRHTLGNVEDCLVSTKVFEDVTLLTLKTVQSEMAAGKTIDYDDFKRSYKILRNVQDWGRKESDDLRERMQRHDSSQAKQASDPSKAGSVTGPKIGSSVYSSGSGGRPRAPQRRASDAGSRRSDGQASSISSKSAERPSITGYTGTSRLGLKQTVPPSASKTMPPPVRRSTDFVSGRVTDQRSAARSPSTTRYPPSASSGSMSGTPRSSRAPSIGPSYSDSRGKNRDGDRRPSAAGLSTARLVDDLDRDRYTDSRYSKPDQYRDRRSPDDIQPFQRRRSDSPQDEPRPPRDLDRDRGRTRGSSRLGDSGRDLDRPRRGTSVGFLSSDRRYSDRRSPSLDRYRGRQPDDDIEPVPRRRLSPSFFSRR